MAGPKDRPYRSAAPADVTTPNDVRVVVGAANLAESIRRYGHLAARLDPLGSEPPGDPSLSTARTRHHRRRPEERCRRRSSAARWPSPRRTPSRRSRSCAASTARRPASTISHVFVPEERDWLRHAAESGRFLPPMDPASARGAARSHHAGRGLRAVPAPHVPRQDALLDRRRGHAGADPRRDHRRRRQPGRAPHDHRHGASRPPERPRAHPREAVRADPRRVQGSGRARTRCASISAGWAT